MQSVPKNMFLFRSKKKVCEITKYLYMYIYIKSYRGQKTPKNRQLKKSLYEKKCFKMALLFLSPSCKLWL